MTIMEAPTESTPEVPASDAEEKKSQTPEPDTIAPPTGTVEFPVRMLFAIGVAAKEAGRYAINAVMVETKGNAVSCIATDGRCLIVADWEKGLFDDEMTGLLIPRDVVAAAIRLAKRDKEADDEEPMVTVESSPAECSLKMTTRDGDAIFNWSPVVTQFPPYREIVPVWNGETGVAKIGINPALLAKTAHAIQKICLNEQTRIYLPTADNRPIGMESFDGPAGIKVTALVMPLKIEEWTAPAPKVDAASGEAGTTSAAWRSVPLEELGIRSARALKALHEHNPPLTTHGELSDWQTRKGNFWATDIKGLGEKGREEIEEAQFAWFAAHPETNLNLVESAQPNTLPPEVEAQAERQAESDVAITKKAAKPEPIAEISESIKRGRKGGKKTA